MPRRRTARSRGARRQARCSSFRERRADARALGALSRRPHRARGRRPALDLPRAGRRRLGARGWPRRSRPAPGRAARPASTELARIRARLLCRAKVRAGAPLSQRHLQGRGDRVHRRGREAGGGDHGRPRRGQPADAQPAAVGTPPPRRQGPRLAARGPEARRGRRPRGHGGHPLYVGHHRSAQGGDAHARQRDLERVRDRAPPEDESRRPWPLRAADVPLLRSERDHERPADGWRHHGDARAVRPRRLRGRDRRASHHDLLRGADHVHPVPGHGAAARLRFGAALLLGGGHAAHRRRTPLARALRALHPAGLRPHRDLALRLLQPRRRVQARLGGHADRERGDEDRGPGGPRGRRRGAGRDRDQGAERDEGVLRERRRHRGVDPRRMVPLRRHRLPRRRRLLLHRRPREGHDQRRRLQGLPARGGRGAVPSRGGEGGGRGGHRRSRARRGGEGVRGARRGRPRDGRGAAGAVPRRRRRLQGAGAYRVRPGAAQEPHGQNPEERPAHAGIADRMMPRRCAMRRSTLAVAALTLAALLAFQAGEAFARAGSGGSRGSRSSSAPARPAPTSPTNPSSPSRQLSSPAPAQPSRGWMGGLMGGLAGFALGGLLGSMLFGGFGHGFGGGIGLFEILLIGGGLFLLFRFMSARRQQQQQPAYATAGAPYDSGPSYAGGSAYGGGAPRETATEEPAVASDLDRGLGYIRSMDPTFDPGFVADAARGLFGDVQRALTARDMSPVSGRLTSRMYTELTEQCDRLRAARQTNRMEAMNLRTADVTEAWQESGQDFVTVHLAGSLVDYTVDDASGALVAGAKAPQEFDEFWTFTRSVGPNPWRLSAIQSS